MWLNDIPELDSLTNMLLWMALQFLNFDNDSTEQAVQLHTARRTWESMGSHPTHLFPNRSGIDSGREVLAINPWFTSLWKLQETCLRPGMWLCVHDWSPLCIHGQSALPLNGLLCIYKRFRQANPAGLFRDPGADDVVDPEMEHFNSRFVDFPERLHYFPLREFDAWITRTGLIKLMGISRVDIISLGDRWHCTGRRAKAIMSALGVTEWYTPGEENDRDLVLGKYPLAFLDELRRKEPGEFFGPVNSMDNVFRFEERERKDPGKLLEMDNAFDFEFGRGSRGFAELNKERGSMLPFGLGFGHHFQNVRLFLGTEHLITHPSLFSWAIEHPDGNCRIKRACILSSPEKALARPEEPLEALLFPQGFVGTKENSVDDLHGWVRTRPYTIYLVVTQHCEYDHPGGRLVGVHGVLLREVRKDTMVKLGTFHMTMYGSDDSEDNDGIIDWRLPDEEEVDWMVL